MHTAVVKGKLPSTHTQELDLLVLFFLCTSSGGPEVLRRELPGQPWPASPLCLWLEVVLGEGCR